MHHMPDFPPNFLQDDKRAKNMKDGEVAYIQAVMLSVDIEHKAWIDPDASTIKNIPPGSDIPWILVRRKGSAFHVDLSRSVGHYWALNPRPNTDINAINLLPFFPVVEFGPIPL